MGTERIGVAISTTGDEHRMGFLETCVSQWRRALPLGSVIMVTVDGTEADTQRAMRAVDAPDEGRVGGTTYRVGQTDHTGDRMGVAVNKNTGLELLMDAGVEHLFLCDDDTWPLNKYALTKHTEMTQPHSMVCWGDGRLQTAYREHAAWTWPRGVLLYVRRGVVAQVGGMDERFVGGHEHAEWSRRIHQHGLTPDPFITPRVYAENGVLGPATRAGSFWHCEDMRRVGEHTAAHRYRRRQITSLPRGKRDWASAEAVMAERDGDTSFVPFTAHENGRASATLCTTSTGQGAGGAE
jgi:hypothetical protein